MSYYITLSTDRTKKTSYYEGHNDANTAFVQMAMFCATTNTKDLTITLRDEDDIILRRADF